MFFFKPIIDFTNVQTLDTVLVKNIAKKAKTNISYNKLKIRKMFSSIINSAILFSKLNFDLKDVVKLL